MDDSRDSDSVDHLETMLLKDSFKNLARKSDGFIKQPRPPADNVVTVNRDCCVKTILGSFLLGTAFVLITIIASNRDDHKSDLHANSMISDAPPDVHWDTNKSGQPRLSFRHQYLIREVRADGFAQILALDEAAKIYVIEVLNEHVKFYKQYVIVNIDKGTETFLLVSRDINRISSNMVEKTVLLCHTQSIPKWQWHRYVPMAVLGKSAVFQSKLHNDIVDMEYVYIGDWMKASLFLSSVVNSSCSGLPSHALFDWGKVDETLACGSNISMKTVHSSCPGNVCSPLSNIPLTKVTTCHKFRRCNFILETCGTFRQNARLAKQPYCACRRAAVDDALRLSCPLPRHDGGECEYPRRDLYSSQRTLPCQCRYSFPVFYPFQRKTDDDYDRKDTFTRERRIKVDWRIRFENKTGPASNFRKCLC